MEENEIPQTKRIKRIEVDGLFGLHSYSVTFSAGHPFSLLIGPNGIGKTTVLAMAEFVADPYDGDSRVLFQTEFLSFKISFEDGKSIAVSRKNSFPNVPTLLFSFFSPETSCQESAVVVYSDFANNRNNLQSISAGLEAFFRAYIKFFSPESLNEKYIQDERKYFLYGLLHYSLHHSACRFFKADHFLDDVCLTFYFERFNCLVSPTFDSPSFLPRFLYHDILIQESEKSSKSILETQILDIIALFSVHYQKRFFEQIYLPSSAWPRFIYTKKNCDLIKKITSYGLPFFTNEKYPHLFDWGNANDDFVFDATMSKEEKREAYSFQAFLLTLNVFSENFCKFAQYVGEMGIGRVAKTLTFSSKGEIVFHPIAGTPFGFECLSSGEKNYITLLFNILFEASFNGEMSHCPGIYLIDEPEISMHIEMQKDFSRNLRQICKLTGCQIICATHSPFLADGDDRLFADFQYNFPKNET